MSNLTPEIFNLAVVGDIHGSWSNVDHIILEQLNPDGLLFVGDFSDGDLRITKKINKISIPTLCILGNHDHGHDKTGEILQKQLNLLGDKHCGWKFKILNNHISVLGARPCSAGGGFYLSKEIKALFGPLTEANSIERIKNQSILAPKDKPLIILSHSGPTGLGSEANSICGRDWKMPFIDWGDRDLSLSIDLIQKERFLDLVVFGHMHKKLNRNLGDRDLFFIDKKGTAYLNAAIVPRYKKNKEDNLIINFSWIIFKNGKIKEISQRWYTEEGVLDDSEILFLSEH